MYGKKNVLFAQPLEIAKIEVNGHIKQKTLLYNKIKLNK